MKVVITRPHAKSCSLIQGLQAHSIETWSIPLVEIKKRVAPDLYQKWSSRLQGIQKIVFLSQHAVEHCPASIFERLHTFPIEILAVGMATKRTLELKGFHQVVVPEDYYCSEGLLALKQLDDIAGQRILLIKGKGGRRLLIKQLRHRGAAVSELYTYERICPKINISPLFKAIQNNEISFVVCTSMAAVENLMRLFGKKGWQILRNMPLLVISQRMKKQLEKLGFKKEPLVSENVTDDSILSSLISRLVKGKHHV